MTEQRQFKPQDVGNELLDTLGAVWKWLVLVAAIAVGTCLGLILFGFVVMELGFGHQPQDVDRYPFVSPPTSIRSP